MSGSESGDSSTWSREQDIMFENALATYSEGLLDRWQKIAADVPGKSIEEIRHHYDLLVEDVNQIESGRVPLPCYQSSSSGSLGQAGNERTSKKGGNFGQLRSDSNHNGKASRSEQERRKGIAWTEDEHKLFLQGLKKYGKGDWRSISRNYVVTRTPTQVASHAQKYYIRLNSENKDRRRSSIHDITNVNNGDMSGPLEPITGQTYDSSAGGSSSKPSKQTHSPLATSGVGMYGGTTIGQPVGGSLVSGTPVNLPQAHIAYGIRAPSGQVVPGAPVNMGPMGYPMPQTSAQR